MRRGWMMLLALVIGLLPAIGALLPAAAQTTGIVVGEGAYGCNYDGLATAISDVDDGGTVTFNCTVTTIDFTETTGNITIDKTVTINGSNNGNPMTFDGNNATNMFVVPTGGNLTVQQLTFLNGNAPTNISGAHQGGAINGEGGDITVLDSTFTSNFSRAFGGAIENGSGTVTISRSTFTNNTAGEGGAIANNAEMTISQSTFTGNNGVIEGGAIWNDNGGTMLTISQSTFRDNKSDGGGGAILNGGALTITDSRFMSNSTTSNGGAIYSYALLTIHRSSFVANHGERGGAIDASPFDFLPGSLALTSSTLSGNTADDDGSAVYVGSELTSASIRWSTIVQPAETSPALAIVNPVTLEGVILAGDGNNCAFFTGDDTSDSSTLSDDASCQLDTTAGSLPSTDPMLPTDPSTIEVNGVEQTYYPLEVDSLAIDAGGTGCDTEDQPDVDQLGNTRPHGTDYLCDIGAIEYWATNEVLHGEIIINGGNPVYAGQTITIELVGTDADDPDLYYTIICPIDPDDIPVHFDEAGTVDWSSATTTRCTTPESGDLVLFAAIVDNINFAAGNNSHFHTNVVVDVLSRDPVDLCANRWTGDIRMPTADHCTTTELQLHITPDTPATLCANRWTGEARYSQYDRCRSTEASYLAEGLNTVEVCVNRWTGDVRIDSRCYSTERSDAL